MRHDSVRFAFASADDEYAELTGSVVVREEKWC